PKVLGVDARGRFFAMEYLEPASHPLWKHQLRDGNVDIHAAQAVGRCLGRIHAVAARREGMKEAFPTGEIFESIRIEPYLRAVARKHEDLASTLHALAARTASRECAFTLVHGDVSPKNILIGP